MNIEFDPKHDSIEQLAQSVELFIQQDPGERGLAKWATRGELFRAAASLAGARHVLIATGFYILSAGVIETDGPPGTIILAETLLRLGKTVTILTDRHAGDILRAGMRSIGCEAELETFSREEGIMPDSLIRRDTTHCVALERPGLASDGRHHNFRGLIISDYVAPLDEVFIECARRGISTIGIGDGGNELGTGNVSEAVDKITGNRPYSCKIPSEICVCAGVSNWGGYALAGLISCLADKKARMPDFDAVSTIIDSIVAAGAVDGVTGKPGPTVDSLPRSWEDSIYKGIYEISR